MRRWVRYFLIGFGLIVLAGVAALGLALWITPDPVPGVVNWPVSPVLLDREGNIVHARLSADEEWCIPVPYEEMGKWMPLILVSVEDQRFYGHCGVDFLALGRATLQNLMAGRVVSGASTITSQLVRISEPGPRTVGTKIYEFVQALKIDWRLSKREILEYYLNRAPFGGTIRGVEAAARQYFGKRARELSLGEAALLVGMLKGPTVFRPDRNPQAALKRRQMIIRQVAENAGVSEELTELALAEPLPAYRPVMPQRAWHFADLAFLDLPAAGGIVLSTLDMKAQQLLEQTLRERLLPMPAGVTAAGIIVDNETAEILAYVGNARFDPVSRHEWVDCARGRRSPGSTLKPFIYAEAFAAGKLIPASLLADTPIRLGGVAPRNFSLKYRGPVTASSALADSLNAPAVRVARMLGVRRTLELLRQAGFSNLTREDSDYGDSLVLGGGEVTMLELARAYTCLATLGADRPLVLESGDMGSSANPGLARQSLKSARNKPGSRLSSRAASHGGYLTPESAWLIAETLRNASRLPLREQIIRDRDKLPVAFKTGTSFGLRDAWTAAYSPAYTVVVWFGKADGGADNNLIGLELAAPGAIRLVREMSRIRPRGKPWYEEPKGIGHVRVCALSGAAPSPWCNTTIMAENIPAVWRTKPCDMHVLRNNAIIVVWPPELEDFTRKRFATDDLSREAVIISPIPGSRYLITPGAPIQSIPLKAEDVTYPVHWYADGLYLGRQDEAGQPLYWTLTPGDTLISLLDAKDRTSSLKISVTDLAAKFKSEELPVLGR